eukprot:9526487-Prorocentrum_lima.AAC.1
MTSSLVGSEMCIRDRMTLLVTRVRCTCIEKDDNLHLHLRVNVCPVVLAAVSYTHLTLPTICSV